ncbi:hypothetical protein BJV78DRAFT_1151702 [Lactifluus subvellereus]|nr:hypothetical protein BJV78DRAFT_1151702 [Lactifluus subvellereus]
MPLYRCLDTSGCNFASRSDTRRAVTGNMGPSTETWASRGPTIIVEPGRKLLPTLLGKHSYKLKKFSQKFACLYYQEVITLAHVPFFAVDPRALLAPLECCLAWLDAGPTVALMRGVQVLLLCIAGGSIGAGVGTGALMPVHGVGEAAGAGLLFTAAGVHWVIWRWDKDVARDHLVHQHDHILADVGTLKVAPASPALACNALGDQVGRDERHARAEFPQPEATVQSVPTAAVARIRRSLNQFQQACGAASRLACSGPLVLCATGPLSYMIARCAAARDPLLADPYLDE